MKHMKTQNNMHIHYDEEGDLLEFRIGGPTLAVMKELGDDIFERIDEKTGKTTGFVILNFKKRMGKSRSVDISLPDSLSLSA